MIARLQSHVRSHIVGYLALFVALGGTSYAAAKLPANSVGTRQIKNGAVTPAKLSPTALAARVEGSEPDPPGGPQGSVAQVVLKAAGRLYVQGFLDAAAFPCANNQACTVTAGLYVDGRPVARSGRAVSGFCNVVFPGQPPMCFPALFSGQTMFGVTGRIRNGTHTVTLGWKATDGAASAPAASPPAKTEIAAVALP